ncbi:MAG: T9SS type A sorting domain-containing protein [Saprospiraceae bacterium]
MKLITLLSTIALIGLGFSSLAQTVYYVTPTGAGTEAGTSWANASADLTAILLATTSGDDVWVAQGTYTPTDCAAGCTEAERETSFALKAGVTLIGGFVGTETTRTQASASNLTTLSGDIGASNDKSDNSYNIVLCDNCGTNAGLENFTLSGGNGNRAASSGPNEIGRAGSALYLNGAIGQANPVVTNCTFTDNTVIGRGGAIFCNGSPGESSPIFRFCTFNGNSSNGEGGALAIDGTNGTANPKFRDCSFTNNQTIYESSVAQSGGAIYGVTQGGNAIVDFNRCLFQNNTADANTTPPAMNNNQNGLGGAMYFTSSGSGNLQLNLFNTILDANTAYSAGAIYNLGGVTKFENVTMTNNTATGSGGSGGGLYVNGGSADIVNSISYGNESVTNTFGGKDIRFVNGTVNISYTLVEAADRNELFSRASNTNADILNDGLGMIYGTDPLLSSPAGYPEISTATSLAVNSGLNSAVTASGGDYLGASRIVAGNIDLGAVESSLAPLPVELISFEAKALDTKIRLDWKVASEIDLDGYKLLRRDPTGGFDEVVFVPAMESGSYFYEDAAIIPGQTYYYQLVSLDLDGTTYDSDLVTARVDASSNEVIVSNLYPNPTDGLLNIVLTPREGARTVYASVLNMNGQRMVFKSYPQDGVHQLNLTDLPNGNYVVRITEGDRTQTEAITIQH